MQRFFDPLRHEVQGDDDVDLRGDGLILRELEA